MKLSSSNPSPPSGGATLRGKQLLVAGACLFTSLLPLTAGDADFSQNLVTTPPAQGDPWEFSFTVNGWGPWVDLELAGGTEVDIGLDDLIYDLEMVAEVEAEVRKGKWGLSAEVIYYEAKTDLDRNIGPRNLGNFGLTEWLISPKISYRVLEGDWGFLDLRAGAFYTHIAVKQRSSGPILGNQFTSLSGEIWDVLGGIDGQFNLSERWYVPFHASITTGDTDYTFGAFAGIGYHLTDHLDLQLGFRYIHYEFDDDFPLATEDAYGPQFSATIKF